MQMVSTDLSQFGTSPRQKRVLLCLSHLRWNFVWQRPQHLLSRAAAEFDVIFFEEPIFEDGVVPQLRSRIEPSGVRVCAPLLSRGLSGTRVDGLQRELLDELLTEIAPRELLTWYYTPMALRFSRHLSPDVCVYDNMDELSAFAGAPPQLLQLERDLFSRCDVVFTGGHSLHQAKQGRHPNVHAFPSSIDVRHFGKARNGCEEPSDLRRIARPRIGFFGVIDERMNLDLVREIASRRSDWQIVMIGPTAKIDPKNLPKAENLHWLGGKSYDELPSYLANWTAGIMPFAINEATRFISPTKTPEFLAAGVPVVSTPIADVVRPYGAAGLVEIASDPETFVTKIAALIGSPKQPWLGSVDRHLATMSWDATWAAMRELLSRGPALVSESAAAAASMKENALV